jgi:hypothetical protein
MNGSKAKVVCFGEEIPGTEATAMTVIKEPVLG